MQEPAHPAARVGVRTGQVHDREQGLGRAHQGEDRLWGLHTRVRRRSGLR